MWTTEIPSKTGWYWVLGTDGDVWPSEIEVKLDGSLWMDGDPIDLPLVAKAIVMWCPAIPPPFEH